jgi:hypothetical protein
MLRSLARLVGAAPFVLLCISCGDDNFTTPTTPTVPIVTDTFSGTLNPNGGATHSFASAGPGQMTATIKSLAPDSTVLIGLSIGIWNGNACTTVVAKDDATSGSSILGTVTGVGLLCARVYDVGRFTEATTYEIEVAHP